MADKIVSEVSFGRLVDIVSQLRDPDNGCPWDLEQTNSSLSKYLIEESNEVVEVLQGFSDDGTTGDYESLKEELGDVLLQVMLHSQLASEEEKFDINDVIEFLSDKLIRRHPHVFGDSKAKTVDEVTQQWELIKQEEKNEKESR